MPKDMSKKTKTTKVAPRKPHGCSQCKKCFTRKSDLKRHVKRHLPPKDREYHCDWDGCNFTANQLGGLKCHVNVKHTGETPHECPLSTCDARFGATFDLERHCIKYHGCTYGQLRLRVVPAPNTGTSSDVATTAEVAQYDEPAHARPATPTVQHAGPSRLPDEPRFLLRPATFPEQLVPVRGQQLPSIHTMLQGESYGQGASSPDSFNRSARARREQLPSINTVLPGTASSSTYGQGASSAHYASAGGRSHLRAGSSLNPYYDRSSPSPSPLYSPGSAHSSAGAGSYTSEYSYAPTAGSSSGAYFPTSHSRSSSSTSSTYSSTLPYSLTSAESYTSPYSFSTAGSSTSQSNASTARGLYTSSAHQSRAHYRRYGQREEALYEIQEEEEDKFGMRAAEKACREHRGPPY